MEPKSSSEVPKCKEEEYAFPTCMPKEERQVEEREDAANSPLTSFKCGAADHNKRCHPLPGDGKRDPQHICTETQT